MSVRNVLDSVRTGIRQSASRSLLVTVALALCAAPFVEGQVPFIRGDANQDGQVTLLDAGLIMFSFPAPNDCAAALDVNNDGGLVGLLDGLALLNALVNGGPQPVAPFPDCGSSLTSALGCNAANCGATPLPLDPDFTLRMTVDNAAREGQPLSVNVFLDRESNSPVWGLSFAVCHDDPGLAIDDLAIGGNILNANPTFASFRIEPGLGWSFSGTSNGPSDPSFNPPVFASDDPIVLAGYATNTAGNYDLTFCSAASLFVDTPIVVVGGSVADSRVPTTIDLPVEVEAAPRFVRGDVNIDLNPATLQDALYLLNWMFNAGPDLPCHDAADVDDSGRVVGLIDGLYMLNFAFLSGSPIPPPNSCGVDPTLDVINCATSLCP